MASSQTHVFVRCKITRGGFTSERAFNIDTTQGKYTGTADVEHLRNADLKPIAADVPPEGQSIDGYIRCRVIRKLVDKNELLVDIPSNVVQVNMSELIRAEENVPV